MNFELFVKERNDALLSLDKDKIDAFCRKYGVELPENEDAYWIGVHKAISGIKGLTGEDKEKQSKSIEWLEERGFMPLLQN